MKPTPKLAINSKIKEHPSSRSVMANFYPEIDLADYIDHTLLDPLATPAAIAQLCEQADHHHFPAVCIFPIHVRQAVELLHHKSPQVCTVIGFPTGAHTSAVKRYEAEEMVEQGATELDVVINLGWLKSGNTEALHRELADICHATGVTVKAILETAVLTDAEKCLAAEICVDAGVSFLKTSTGWQGGATVADVKLLQAAARGLAGIKASGGIHTATQALELILAGATRLGTSRGIDLLRQRETAAAGD
jgi:deoxyribose-phosphate aldolase